ncbi:hypothetical protein ACIQRW_34525 [Streptomyces sp. NPDC091287]|uniref:hypothetical protein n=1 Tax=Streptomyces sp. NPDC091287 TaxID=3365988 RepID=UPI0037F5D8E2
MTKRDSTGESLRGGGFLKGSAAGVSDMLLGWRSLFLGLLGTVGGFVGAITNSGVTARLTLVAIGCVSVVLAAVSWKYMKRQRDDRNARRRHP